MLLHSRIGAMTWVAVLLAVTGLGVLTLGDVSSGLGLGYGEALTLVSALIYALHIVGLGRLVGRPRRARAWRSSSAS